VIIKNILEQIPTTLKILLPSKRKVAKYIFHNLNKVILLTATQIVVRARVSEATVIRFVNSLGFSGFSDFKGVVGEKFLADYFTSTRLVDSAKTFKCRSSLYILFLTSHYTTIIEV